MPQHTMLCGYCNQPFPAGSACGCEDSQRRLAARERERLTRLSLGADGPAYWTLTELTASASAWWTIAGLVAEALDRRGLEWSLASGGSRAAYCATVQRETTRDRPRPRIALGWSDQRGLALCIAALDALLGRDAWPSISPTAPLTHKELCP